MNNPSIETNNVITAHQEIELSFAPGRAFKMRKADLLFDGWCQDNYESVQNFFNIIQTCNQPGTDAKRVADAIIRAFYHLISREDQIFIRDKVEIENMLDEDGNERKLTIIDKLMVATDLEDVGAIVRAIWVAKGLATPNPLSAEEKKKKKSSPRTAKKTK
jgi:hypothetical protein